MPKLTLVRAETQPEDEWPQAVVDNALRRHGAPPKVAWVPGNTDDPEMWNVTVDMAAWSRTHPCECDARCVCP